MGTLDAVKQPIIEQGRRLAAAIDHLGETERRWLSLATFGVLVVGLSAALTAAILNTFTPADRAGPGTAQIALRGTVDGNTAKPRQPAGPGIEQLARSRTQAPAAGTETESATRLAETNPAPALPLFETKSVELKSGDTLMEILVEAGAPRTEAYNAIEAMRDMFDPRKMRLGQTVDVTLKLPSQKAGETTAAETDSDALGPVLAAFQFQPDAERMLHVLRQADDGYTVRESQIKLQEEFVHARGRIDSSLFLAADDVGIPPTITIELIRMYSYNVDFQREIRQGDEFEIFFTRYLNDEGKPVKDGHVHFGSLTLSGKRHALYRYTTPDDGATDYFDETGQSAKKFLMKTPVDGARLSSGFGSRKHPILGYTKMHKGTDFAAPRGTPIMAAGNGVVKRANRFGSFGNYIRLKHANGYETADAQLHGFAKGVTAGARVQQGQIIGYVGTTGRSTGPHLHYEVLHNGKHVNPMTIRVPTGRKLEGDVLEDFLRERSRVETQMVAIPPVSNMTTAQLETSVKR